jgi:pyroglutamyl-peptidase
MTALVTGFDPFGEAELNASELVVTALADLNDTSVVTAILPTSYRRAEAQMDELIRTHGPDLVLMLGLSGKATNICLEQVALNLNDSSAPDNDGEVRQLKRIHEDGPVGYWSSLPLEAMAEEARRLGEDTVFSRDAGSYVCNHLFFTAAHLVATKHPDCRCGFVHLPPLEGPGERLDRFVQILRSWIANHSAA